MPTAAATFSLRQTDRKRLLRHLVKLGASDPGDRADAALAVTTLLESKGIAWSSLVPTARNDTTADDGDGRALDWRALAFRLSEHADLAPPDRAYALRLTKWRAPGCDGLNRLREMAGRLGLDLN